MGQISVEIMRPTGSLLGGNQHRMTFDTREHEAINSSVCDMPKLYSKFTFSLLIGSRFRLSLLPNVKYSTRSTRSGSSIRLSLLALC